MLDDTVVLAEMSTVVRAEIDSVDVTAFLCVVAEQTVAVGFSGKTTTLPGVMAGTSFGDAEATAGPTNDFIPADADADDADVSGDNDGDDDDGATFADVPPTMAMAGAPA